MSFRAATLPLDHLDAELIAAPFSDEAGLRFGLVALDPQLRRGDTVALWRSVENRIARSFPGMSLDEIIGRRDRLWFGEPGRGLQPLVGVLRAIGAHLARGKSSSAAPSVTRRRLRWLTFALPLDLPGAVMEAADPGPPLVSPVLSRLLAEGLVEPHLHLGASFDFETAWIAAQHALAATDCRADLLASPGAVFDEGRGLAGWLVRSFIVRAVLARALCDPRAVPFGDSLDARISRLPPIEQVSLSRILRSIERGRIDDEIPFASVGRLYRLLVGIGPGAMGLPDSLDAMPDADGIAYWFRPGDGRSAEQLFVRSALDAMTTDWGKGRFARLFWQVTRVRVMLYRHLVQRPMVGGLQWFTRTYARIRPIRRQLAKSVLLESACRMSGTLDALEVRVTPESTSAAMAKKIESIVPTSKDGPDVGLILHFPRSRGTAHRQGRPAAFDRGTVGEPGAGGAFRFARYYRARRAEARAIIDLLRTRPMVVEVLRGVDLCGDELGVQSWVLAPLLDAIRRAGRRAAAQVNRPGRSVGPLRLMVHAGEDYVHLLGGLRRVDSLVERLDLGEGDRIAHGLALGEHVGRWCDRALGRVQSREERLLDLLWAWRRLRDEPSTTLAAWGTWLEAQIRRLSRLIFPSEPSVEMLVEARACLYDRFALAALGFPERPVAAPGWRAGEVALAWISDPGVFRRGSVLEEVDPRPIADLIEHLQRQVRQRLSARSVVVEINPSSNLLIGGFGDLEQHPLWRLRPVELDDQPSLMVTLGTDDPITFATTLPAEYQLVYDTLIGAGVSSDRALAWLDDARRTSLRARVALHDTGGGVRGQRWPGAVVPLPDEFLPG